MNPTRNRPFNPKKTPIQTHLRVWVREENSTELRPFLLRRYKNGHLYWSELLRASAGCALCLTCMQTVPRTQSAGPCPNCRKSGNWLDIPR